MPAPRGKLTDLPELGAYVLAHMAGLAWVVAVNPTVFRSLVAQGYREHLMLLGIANSIVISIVVLLIFLALRKLLAGTVAPPQPPADRPMPPPKLTDGPELAAYVLAHAAGIAWGFTTTPLIFRSLIAQGLPAFSLALVGLAMSIAVSVVVLLIFLFLRKAMAGPAASA